MPNTPPAVPAAPTLLPAAVALALGIAAGRHFPHFPYTITALSLIGAAALIFWKRLTMRQKASAILFYGLGILAFYAYGPGARTPLEALIDKGPVTLTGEVVRPPKEMEGCTVLYLRPDMEDGIGGFMRRRAGLARLSVEGTGLDINYGDVLTGVVKLSRPRGYDDPGVFDRGQYMELSGVDAAGSIRPGGLTRLGSRAVPVLGRLYRLRGELIARARASLPGPASSIFRAVVLGDQGGITDEMRDEFAASGTTHILSVSGSQVALLAALVFFIVRWSFFLLPHPAALRLSMIIDARKAAAVIALLVAALYCVLAGSRPPTVRAVIMLGVYLSAIVFELERDLINTLAFAVLAVLIIDPSSLFDISFQVSYAAVLACAVALYELNRPGGAVETAGPLGAVSRHVSGGVFVSLAATMGSAPLIFSYFNNLSYFFLPANLIVMPLAAFTAVPVGLLSCLIYAISPSASLPLAWLNSALLDAFYFVVRLLASVPHANLHPPGPGFLLTLIFYTSAAAVVFWDTGRAKKGAAVLSCFAVFLAADYIRPGGRGVMRATFLDVGHGDSVVVELPYGETMLIDGGGSPMGLDPGRAVVAPYLWNRGIHRVDYVVLSHPHHDHVGGLSYIIKNFEVGQVWEGGMVNDSEEYVRFREAVEAAGAPRYTLIRRGEMPIGGATVQVLNFASAGVGDSGRPLFVQENDRSDVLRIKYGEISLLFTGDIEREAEDAMLSVRPPLPLKSTVLKSPHHGGPGSLTDSFIAAVSPSVAVISEGRQSRYEAPSPGTVKALEDSGARVYVTSRDGAVTVETDGSGLFVHSQADTRLTFASSWQDERENWRRVLR